MSQWPPSPSVEDEITALSHEHTNQVIPQVVKTEEEPVVSRGSVDQYPIIVDSDDQREAVRASTNKSARREEHPSGGNSSDDSTGPPTPPAVNAKPQTRPGPVPRAKSVSFEEPASSSKSVNDVDHLSSGRGRPQVSRIETNLGGDLHSMATGSRRAPSPYSYSRTSAEQKSSPVTRVPFLSSDYLTASPAQAPLTKRTPTSSIEHDSTHGRSNSHVEERSERSHRSKSHRRDSESRSESKPKQGSLDPSTSAHRPHHRSPRSETVSLQQDGYSRPQGGDATMTPPQSRRGSRDAPHVPIGEDRRAALGTMHSGQDSSAIRDSPRGSPFASPYTSSAEESHTRHRHRRNSRHGNDEAVSRRPSSHRKERPRMGDPVDRLQSGRSDPTAVQETAPCNRASRQQSQPIPATPLTADAAKTMEDYFERALRDHERRPKHSLAPRVSGSAIASPITSPPRTPKSESHRQSKEYFEVNTASQRPIVRSRPPSMDEEHLLELKAHVSLLSAATTGAAKAARASGDLHKSGTSSAEHSSGTPTSKPPSVSGSRRSSPSFEDTRPPIRPGPYVPMEKSRSTHPSTTVIAEVRPTPRGSIYVLDHPVQPQAQRSFSYSGQEQVRASISPPSNVPQNIQSHAMPAMPVGPAVVSSRSRALDGPTEVRPATSNVLVLPNCPRAQPTTTYKDWWTIKEVFNIDICPTCMSVIGNTRFRDQFVKSLPRPYNEPSVCAMSKPWFRIAFLQSLRQGRSNLDYMRALSTLPAGTRPCAGDKPDVRMWFDIYDSSTNTAVPNFVACSACVRAIDNIFPELENMLGRPKGALIQEKVCSLNVNSKNFLSFIDQFEKSASRCRGHRWRQSDVQPLVDHVRQATRHGECPKDRMLATRAWHFMPDLPEFTICEACYFDVVWPLSDKPIARDISKTTKLVPTRGNSGVSCQLYSDRMRKIFREAVLKRNMSQLKEVAKTRQGTQQRLVEMNRLYEQDQQYGIDRRAEMERNNAIWRQLE